MSTQTLSGEQEEEDSEGGGREEGRGGHRRDDGAEEEEEKKPSATQTPIKAGSEKSLSLRGQQGAAHLQGRVCRCCHGNMSGAWLQASFIFIYLFVFRGMGVLGV